MLAHLPQEHQPLPPTTTQPAYEPASPATPQYTPHTHLFPISTPIKSKPLHPHEQGLTPISQPKNFIPGLKVTICPLRNLLDNTRELYTQRRRRLRRNGILALALQQVHAVQTEGFDLHEGLSREGGGLGDVVDKEVFGGAGVVFDSWLHGCQPLGDETKLRGAVPIALMVDDILEDAVVVMVRNWGN